MFKIRLLSWVVDEQTFGGKERSYIEVPPSMVLGLMYQSRTVFCTNQVTWYLSMDTGKLSCSVHALFIWILLDLVCSAVRPNPSFTGCRMSSSAVEVDSHMQGTCTSTTMPNIFDASYSYADSKTSTSLLPQTISWQLGA